MRRFDRDRVIGIVTLYIVLTAVLFIALTITNILTRPDPRPIGTAQDGPIERVCENED